MPLTRTRTPATPDHAISLSPITTRFGRVVVVLALCVGMSSVVRGLETGPIEDAAAVSSHAIRVTVRGMVFPIDPEPTCEVFDNFGGFSKAFGEGAHQGLDIGADLGQEVYAAEAGQLYREFSGENSGLGWGLWGESDTKYRYFHLDSFADGVEVGDRVAAGQLIGYVGDTGNAAPGGWHLHFEVRPGPHPRYGASAAVDPVPLLPIPESCTVY